MSEPNPIPIPITPNTPKFRCVVRNRQKPDEMETVVQDAASFEECLQILQQKGFIVISIVDAVEAAETKKSVWEMIKQMPQRKFEEVDVHPVPNASDSKT